MNDIFNEDKNPIEINGVVLTLIIILGCILLLII